MINILNTTLTTYRTNVTTTTYTNCATNVRFVGDKLLEREREG
jgi:hypothetical protein